MSNLRFYKVFKNKITNAFHLERRVFIKKFSKEDKYLIRAQYVVYLVACLESFFSEIFRNVVDKKIMNLDKISKIRKMKFSLEDLKQMKKGTFSIAERLTKHMNFQNMDEIHEFCKALEFNKYSQMVRKTLKKSKKDKNKEIKKLFKILLRQKDKSLDNLHISKSMIKLTINQMIDDKILLELFSADKCFGTIIRMIKLRHRIVHEAGNVKIENWESWAYTLATMQFANIVNRIYELKLSEK